MEGREDPARVVIAGAGVAGVEALLALRAMPGPRLDVELIAPDPDFVYRPLAVAAPFGLGEPRRIPIRTIVEEHGAALREDALAGVEPEGHIAVTQGGDRVPYDALLVAIGTHAQPALPGAITFAGAPGRVELEEILGALDAGRIRRVAFVVPPATAWSLPMYELALMTAQRTLDHGLEDVELTLVTHEHTPLGIFGRQASERVGELLHDAGVALVLEAVARRADASALELVGRDALPVDAVVCLPRLTVPRIPGLPQDADGFIPTDAHGRVEGLAGVYAAGDATSFPVKQGGIATQQADAAAEAIAAAAGAPVTPTPPHLVLRGALLTGTAPEFLVSDAGEHGSMSGRGALWWPPGKVAGRHLAPYLARRAGDSSGPGSFTDLADYTAEDPEAAGASHEEALKLALSAADAEASWGDYATALRWLDVAESLNVVLPEDYLDRREAWRAETATR